MRPLTSLHVNLRCHRTMIVLVVLMATSAALLVQGAPVSDSDSSQSLETISEGQTDMLVTKIMQSGKEDECNRNSERKDLCERCIRFVFERTAGYLGCCTNYDGIYDFCEKFLNYSFVEQPKSEAKMHKTFRQQ